MTELTDALRAIVGEAHVLVSDADTLAFRTSARRVAGRCAAVVRPAATDEVAAVVRLSRQLGFALVPQGGNTGLSEGATPADADAVVLSLARLRQVREIDTLGFTMTLEAGVVLADAQARAAEAGLLLPISLGAEGSCQIGGNLATNAGGRSVLRHGMARDSVLGLEVVLPDGTVWNGLKKLRKNNSGYDLKQLFIGSEGTLGIITAAVLRLAPAPVSGASAFAAVADPGAAVALLARLRRRTGDAVSSFEVMNRFSMEVPSRHMPGAARPFGAGGLPHWAVLVELSTSRPGDDLSALLETALGEAMEEGEVSDAVVAQNTAQARAFWQLRDEGTAFYWKEGGFLLHDPSVPVAAIPAFIAAVHTNVEAAVPGARVSAFGHIGDGNIHIIVSQPVGADKAGFIARRGLVHDAVYGAAVALGGSFSAEHGVGSLKLAQLQRFGEPAGLALMRAIKNAVDPDNRMNPGKVLARAGADKP